MTPGARTSTGEERCDAVTPGWRCPACHLDNRLDAASCGCGYAKAYRPEVFEDLPPRPRRSAGEARDVLVLILILLAAWYLW